MCAPTADCGMPRLPTSVDSLSTASSFEPAPKPVLPRRRPSLLIQLPSVPYDAITCVNSSSFALESPPASASLSTAVPAALDVLTPGDSPQPPESHLFCPSPMPPRGCSRFWTASAAPVLASAAPQPPASPTAVASQVRRQVSGRTRRTMTLLRALFMRRAGQWRQQLLQSLQGPSSAALLNQQQQGPAHSVSTSFTAPSGGSYTTPQAAPPARLTSWGSGCSGIGNSPDAAQASSSSGSSGAAAPLPSPRRLSAGAGAQQAPLMPAVDLRLHAGGGGSGSGKNQGLARPSASMPELLAALAAACSAAAAVPEVTLPRQRDGLLPCYRRQQRNNSWTSPAAFSHASSPGVRDTRDVSGRDFVKGLMEGAGGMGGHLQASGCGDGNAWGRQRWEMQDGVQHSRCAR